jgi:hypothetical protein
LQALSLSLSLLLLLLRRLRLLPQPLQVLQELGIQVAPNLLCRPESKGINSQCSFAIIGAVQEH